MENALLRISKMVWDQWHVINQNNVLWKEKAQTESEEIEGCRKAKQKKKIKTKTKLKAKNHGWADNKQRNGAEREMNSEHDIGGQRYIPAISRRRAAEQRIYQTHTPLPPLCKHFTYRWR